MQSETSAPGSTEEAARIVAQVKSWHHKFEIFPGVVTPGAYDPQFLWDLLRLPTRLDSMRALDIGACDGYFTKRLAAAGADVIAIDMRNKDLSGFGAMERCAGRTFDYRQVNLYELDPRSLGMFDIILLLGVLYHLPDMMRGFDIVRRLSRGRVFIESHVEGFGIEAPLARYLPGKALGGVSNHWAPNVACVAEMTKEAGLRVMRSEEWGDLAAGHRALFEAHVADMPNPKLDVAYGRRPFPALFDTGLWPNPDGTS